VDGVGAHRVENRERKKINYLSFGRKGGRDLAALQKREGEKKEGMQGAAERGRAWDPRRKMDPSSPRKRRELTREGGKYKSDSPAYRTHRGKKKPFCIAFRKGDVPYPIQLRRRNEGKGGKESANHPRGGLSRQGSLSLIQEGRCFLPLEGKKEGKRSYSQH